MTNYTQRNFHVWTTHWPLEPVQQILAFPVVDKFLMIVYSKVCYETLWALSNWKKSSPFKIFAVQPAI